MIKSLNFYCFCTLLLRLQMEKTEKTMAELQVEKNLSYEFDKITEAGADLQPLSGEG